MGKPSRRHLLTGLAAAGLWPWHALAQARAQREVLVFYYGWYGTRARSGADIHWLNPDTTHERIEDSPNYPVGGPYDSLDPVIIDRQMAQIKAAGITGLIASWWGQNDRTDQQLPMLFKVAAEQGLKIAVYLENAASPEAIAEDIIYLHQQYGDHPAWLRLNGKKVLFVYDRLLQSLTFEGWEKARMLAESHAPGAFAFVGPAAGRKQMQLRKSAFDGFHIYDMPYELNQKHQFESLWRRGFYKDWINAQKTFSVITATVMPGFDDRQVEGRPPPRPVINRENGKLFRQLLAGAIAARPDWILIVSFNEWHEASQIEPSTAFGMRELQTVKEMSAQFRP